MTYLDWSIVCGDVFGSIYYLGDVFGSNIFTRAVFESLIRSDVNRTVVCNLGMLINSILSGDVIKYKNHSDSDIETTEIDARWKTAATIKCHKKLRWRKICKFGDVIGSGFKKSISDVLEEPKTD